MNEKLTQKLIDDFPRLYRGGEETLMRWGFACGDGWFDLVYQLSEAIEKEAKAAGLGPMAKNFPQVVQVKEKFGTLSYYMRGFRNEAINALVQKAGGLSAEICEGCGHAGTLRKGGWWHVACDACEAKKK